MTTLLQVEDLTVTYQTPRGVVHAVSEVNLDIKSGETVGLVGETGCGKSSLAKAVVRLREVERGAIRLNGVDLVPLSDNDLQPHRRLMSIIFQDPAASLDPRRSISWLIEEPLRVNGEMGRGERASRVAELMKIVGLRSEMADRYPHELSGGQRQRVAIARAIALSPNLVICDEPVSALDISLQAQILNLLVDLQENKGLSYLFVSHDLSVVEYIAHRVVVMYLGCVVEVARNVDLWRRPAHPYTIALIESVPLMKPREQRIEDRQIVAGDIPSPYNPPTGCRFHTRCPRVMPICSQVRPKLKEIAPGHLAACHLYS